MNQRIRTTLFAIGLSAFAIAPAAMADEWNQKTFFTFSGPVEIPGQVLPAGTYVFKLANSQSDRHIVQVFNKDENRIFGTFLAIPDYRMHVSSEPIIRFTERPAGSPPAVKAWVYPGRNYGHEFVYPKKKAVQLAAVNHTPVPAMPTELEPDTTIPMLRLDSVEVVQLEQAPLKAEQPNGNEVELADAFEVTPAAEMPEELPATGSSLPLIGLVGLATVASAFALRLRVAQAAKARVR
jgi:hypothetical protein